MRDVAQPYERGAQPTDRAGLAAQRARREAIWKARVLHGRLYKDVAFEFGISGNRARELVAKEAKAKALPHVARRSPAQPEMVNDTSDRNV